MEELLALLAGIALEDLIPAALVIISEDVFAALAFDAEVLGDVLEQIVGTYTTFQSWCASALPGVTDILNGILVLQLVFNMIAKHYQLASAQSRCVSVEIALQDIEATLVAHDAQLVALANKQIALPTFPQLSPDAQAALRTAAQQTPHQYWVSARVPIMEALLKIPMYAP